MIVYHYTSDEACNEIIRANEFRPSFFSTTFDAAYGEGWYFTDLPPNTRDEELYRHLWGQHVPQRVRCYLEFDIDGGLLQNTRLHVYRLPLDRVRGGVIKLNANYTLHNRVVIRFIRWGRR
jgi:hypothetical protein